MAKTPTSYDPAFWSSAIYRSLIFYAGASIGDARAVVRLLADYFRRSPEKPTHFSYKLIGDRKRKLKIKSVENAIEAMGPAKGIVDSMYIEAIREDDHTHAVASIGYNYSEIGRQNATVSACAFEEDFDLSMARAFAISVSEVLSIDYGFSSCRNGLVDALGFGNGLRIDSDPFSIKRERWIQKFDLSNPRPSEVPFLNVFELNVLSDIHMSTIVAGKSFEAYVRHMGRGTLERIGKRNFLWCLEPIDIVRAKAELADFSLVAMT